MLEWLGDGYFMQEECRFVCEGGTAFGCRLAATYVEVSRLELATELTSAPRFSDLLRLPVEASVASPSRLPYLASPTSSPFFCATTSTPRLC